MKKCRYLFAICSALLIIAATIVVIFCIPIEKNIDDPKAIYNEMQTQESTDSVAYKITKTDIISAGDEKYIRETQFSINIRDQLSDSPTLFVQKNISIGENNFSITEWYQNNNLIIEINGTLFSSHISAEEIKQRYIPQILLNPDIYASINGIETREILKVHFTDATEPENWLSQTDITLEQAEGEVVLHKDRTLSYQTYSASYHNETSHIESHIKSEKIDALEDFPEVISNDNISIQFAYAPELLEQACGFLLASKTIESQYQDSILCEAFGDLQTQNIKVNVNDVSGLTAKIETQVMLENTGKTGSQNCITKAEVFANGKYTISINEGVIQESKTVSELDMRNLYQNILISTIMLPDHIEECTVATEEDSLTFTFSANDAFTEQAIADACAKLYEDPEILNNQCQAYTTNQSTCYLVVDRATGIPISSGFLYSGTYTINSITYDLEYSSNQDYSLFK